MSINRDPRQLLLGAMDDALAPPPVPAPQPAKIDQAVPRRLQGATNDWRTPDRILNAIRRYGPIVLDPCTSADNPVKATIGLTAEQDGLKTDWLDLLQKLPAAVLPGQRVGDRRQGVFVNPPYSTEAGKPSMPLWTAKIAGEAIRIQAALPNTVVFALLPCGARFSTRYFQAFLGCGALTAVCWIKGRVAFVNPAGQAVQGNNYDSALYCFGGEDYHVLAECLAPLGQVWLVDAYEPD